MAKSKVHWVEDDRVVTLDRREIDGRTSNRGIERDISVQIVRTIVASHHSSQVRGPVVDGVVTIVVEYPNQTAASVSANANYVDALVPLKSTGLSPR